MCLTLEPAKLSSTIIYAAEVQSPEGQLRHVIGYQNKAVSRGPNAMILPIPAAGSLGQENVIDTRVFKGVLDNYAKAVKRLNPTFGFRRKSVTNDALFQVFESGSYTIALADSGEGIDEALKFVPENKRPRITPRFLSALESLYPGWPLAVCCFEGELEAPEPLLWWYEPKFPSYLFAPAIDAHDGNPPDITQRVRRDHTIVFASEFSDRYLESSLYYDLAEVPVEHQWLFSRKICGAEIHGLTGNGDFVLPVDQVRDRQVNSYLANLDVSLPPVAPESVWARLTSDAVV